MDMLCFECIGQHKIEIPQELPIHLLDQLRKTVLHDPYKKHQGEKIKDIKNKKSKQNPNEEDFEMITYRI